MPRNEEYQCVGQEKIWTQFTLDKPPHLGYTPSHLPWSVLSNSSILHLLWMISFSAFKSLFSLFFLNCGFYIWGSHWLYQKLSRQQGVNLNLKKKKENPQYLVLSLVQKEGKNPKPLHACSEAAVSSPVGFVCKSFHTKRSRKYINRTFPRLKYLGCYFLLYPNWCFFVKFPRDKNAVIVFGFFPTLMSQCPTLCLGIC